MTGAGLPVELSFQQFDLEETLTETCYDSVTVLDGKSRSQSSVFNRAQVKGNASSVDSHLRNTRLESEERGNNASDSWCQSL